MTELTAPSGTGRRSGAATIYDIAAEAGVNPSTVSRALGRPGRVSEGTSRRVLEAARRLNYRPNPMARALPTGRTQAMGLIVADLTNPVFFDVVRGAQSAAAQGNYTLLLAESSEDPEQELLAAQRMAAAVDGLILATTRLGDEQIETLAAHRPVVVINRELASVASISPDVVPGIDGAVAHLHHLGHRRIAYLAGPERSWMNHRRREALESAAARLGIETVVVQSAGPNLEGGRASFAAVRDASADAVLAYNDLLAIGLLQRCQDEGVNVPGELSIVGFDDIFGADLTSPRLTTIRSPLRDCGNAAVRSLAVRLGDDADADHVPRGGLITDLVVRGSTGPKPRKAPC